MSRGLERSQDRGHVALALERRTGDAADADSELLAEDVGEARLAEARGADEQYVVERLAARAGGLERDRELLLDPSLADELGQTGWAERDLDQVLGAVLEDRREQLVLHAALRSARRTRSSAGSSGSISASAWSASTSE